MPGLGRHCSPGSSLSPIVFAFAINSGLYSIPKPFGCGPRDVAAVRPWSLATIVSPPALPDVPDHHTPDRSGCPSAALGTDSPGLLFGSDLSCATRRTDAKLTIASKATLLK